MGRHYVNIEVGRKWVKLYQPTIYKVCQIIEAWSELEFTEKGLTDIVDNRKPAIKGLAHALGGNPISRLYYYYQLNRCTTKQLKANSEILIGVLGAHDFFQAASWMRNATMMVARPKL